ncbi:unnamed protein product [Triticum turgidum subsp. durum]|uniref:SHSP domain-containing protein n=1 Tax=Triticum turgidum subsp. durum TaxID=4567 RepID=A0A9R1S1Y3_TRITD|nr:unnamed protein product [Triticum turgidum subsp. durum]
MASRQESSVTAADLDPVYEWVDGDGSYLLRLNLPEGGVPGARGPRGPAQHPRPQNGGWRSWERAAAQGVSAPSTSDLDAITGRYDANVLTLTVPKLPSAPAANDVGDKPVGTDEKSKVIREAERLIQAARARLQQGRHKEEKVDDRKQEAEATTPAEKVVKAQDHNDKLEYEAATQRDKKGCWKEGFTWADAIGRKNKEVIAATAVAAFTLGVFVSHRLFSRN